jgi:hypothetical protein
VAATAQVRAPSDLQYEPNDVFPYAQLAYHTCPASEIFYGGAAGGGKSEATLWDAIKNCRTYPGGRAVIFRRTMSELNDLIDRATHYVPESIAVYNRNDDRFIFKNETAHNQPSILRFSHMHEERDRFKHRGEEYTWAYFDEAALFTPLQMRYIRATRNRSPRGITGFRARAKFKAASNPGGPGHADLLTRYVEPAVLDVLLLAYWSPEDKQWIRYPTGYRGRPAPFIVWQPDDDEERQIANADRLRAGLEAAQPRSRCYIPAKLEDNPYLYNDPDYESSLLELAHGDLELYRAMRHGDWSSFEGQVFVEFNPRHHLIDPFTPPAHWPVWGALDWGFAAPLCHLWLAQQPDTRQVFVWNELYRHRLHDSEAVRLIKNYTSRRVDFSIADPSMWKAESNDDALSRAEIFQEKGLLLVPANNDRLAGVARVHELLAIDPLLGPEDDGGNPLGAPRLQITRNCANLARTLPNLPRSETRPEDVDTESEDHAYDALRYGVMNFRTRQSKQKTATRRPGIRLRIQ